MGSGQDCRRNSVLETNQYHKNALTPPSDSLHLLCSQIILTIVHFQSDSFQCLFRSLTSSWLKVTSEAVSMKLMDLRHGCHWVPRLSIPKYSVWCVCPCPNMFYMPEDVEMMSCWHRLCLPHCLDFISWGTFYLGCASQGHHCIKQEPTNCYFLGDLIVSAHSKAWVRVTLGFSGTWQSKLTQSSLVESRKKVNC